MLRGTHTSNTFLRSQFISAQDKKTIVDIFKSPTYAATNYIRIKVGKLAEILEVSVIMQYSDPGGSR